MPYISEARYTELLGIQSAASEIKTHVDAWIELLERYIETLPPDDDLGSGEEDRSYAKHELHAMRRDLGALFSAAALAT